MARHFLVRPLVATLASIAAAIVANAACSTGSPASPGLIPGELGDGGAGAQGAPFVAEVPRVYVAKVKNVLVGLPPTDAEVQAVEKDPTQLGALVDGWMKLPQYTTKMMRFFELAFQQTQVSLGDFADQSFPQNLVFNGTTGPLLLQNAQESFARTMLALIAQGKPLTVGMTTQTLMMTTAMKEMYAFFESREVDDTGKVTDYFRQANPTLSITVTAHGPIPIDQTLDPSSPNYMHWYDPDVATAGAQIPGCQMDPIVYPASASSLHFLLYGSLDNRKGSNGNPCGNFGGTAQAPQLQPSDFSDWQLVTLRSPNGAEPVTPFWNLPALRSAKELVVTTPRVGFFTTPAFFANWQTNVSNQARVTTHQALIVATGSSFDGTDTTQPQSAPGLDEEHAKQAACVQCHLLLDPTRSILAANFSWNYYRQKEAKYANQPGLFAFRGYVQPVQTVADFGNALATHPLFASGWAQKLCYYVNSAPCADADVQAFASTFKSSGYDWTALVKAVVTSPVTTHAAATDTAAASGEVVAVARRDHLCASLDARLGIHDVCGLDATTPRLSSLITAIVTGLPSDGYGRGAPVPILPTQPTLFYRAGGENICEAVAAQVIDNPKPPPGSKQWSSAEPDAAIADFVGLIMGLTAHDPRAAQATALLKAHFQSASKQSGITPTQALQSTFVVACVAPSSVTIGL